MIRQVVCPFKTVDVTVIATIADPKLHERGWLLVAQVGGWPFVAAPYEDKLVRTNENPNLHFWDILQPSCAVPSTVNGLDEHL